MIVTPGKPNLARQIHEVESLSVFDKFFQSLIHELLLRLGAAEFESLSDQAIVQYDVGSRMNLLMCISIHQESIIVNKSAAVLPYCSTSARYR
jgi:hypothetical protein